MVDYRSLLGLKFEPSDEQNAILRRNEDTIVRALPGSGKTTILTLKLKERLLSGSVTGKICCISYTNLNVSDLKEECEKIMPEEMLRNVEFLTFHGFCQRYILQPYGYLTKRPNGHRPFSTLFDFEIHGEKLIEYMTGLVPAQIDKVRRARAVRYNFEREGVAWKLVSELEETTVNRYLSFLKANHLLDFNLILRYSIQILYEWEYVQNVLNSTFDWIFIDEFQDVSELQFGILTLLRQNRWKFGHGAKWFLVGDPNQSIYGFAGANPKSMFEVGQFFNNLNGEGCEYILKISYRCSLPVFAFVRKNYNKVIQLLLTRIESVQHSPNGFDSYLTSLLIPDHLAGNHHDGIVRFSGWEDSMRLISDLDLNSNVCCIGVDSYDSIDLFQNFQGDNWTFGELARVFWESVTFDSLDQSKELFSFFCSYLRIKMAVEFANGDYHKLLARFRFFISKMVARIGTDEMNEFVVDRIIADTLCLREGLNLHEGVEIESQKFLQNFRIAIQKYLQKDISITSKPVDGTQRPVALSDFVSKLQNLDSEGTFFEIKHIHKIKGLEYKKIIVRRTDKIPYKSEGNKLVHNAIFGNVSSSVPISEKELLNYIQELNKLYVMLTRSKTDVFIDNEGGLCKFIDPSFLDE